MCYHSALKEQVPILLDVLSGNSQDGDESWVGQCIFSGNVEVSMGHDEP